jgi:hypothetical protein
MTDFVRILPDEGEGRATHADPQDRGWRLRLHREDGESTAHVYEEQVFPERVHRPDVNHFRAQNEITLNASEQAWLRDALTEMLGEIVDVEGLKAEIVALRRGEPSPAEERLHNVRQCLYSVTEHAAAERDRVGIAGAHIELAQMRLALTLRAELDGVVARCECGHSAHLHGERGRDQQSVSRCDPGRAECRCTLSCERVIELAYENAAIKLKREKQAAVSP